MQMPCTATSLGKYYVMVNFAGRKAAAGFVYRIIGASSDNNNTIQRILELRYTPGGTPSSYTVVSDTNPTPMDPNKYMPFFKGEFITYTAGVNSAEGTWTVVFILCDPQCEVSSHSLAMYRRCLSFGGKS